MPKITVIMPSLNVAEYIRPCMESVLAQSLTDIEILAIDAGSDDGTLEILREYADADSRIKLIYSEKKSYGYQVNIGIELAKGEYIGFVETDDIITNNMFKILYETAVISDVEYVKGNFEKFIDLECGMRWRDSSGSTLENKSLIGKVIVPKNMPELLMKDRYLWTGIYKKDFIKGIRLNETQGAAFQDISFLVQAISTAQKAIYLDKSVYLYRQDNRNASGFNQNGFRYLIQEYDYTKQFLNLKDQKWRNYYYLKMLYQCLGRFGVMAATGAFWNEAESDMIILQKRLSEAVEKKWICQEYMDLNKRKELDLYLQGTKVIYSYCLERYQRNIKEIKDIFSVVGTNKVVIFGSGIYGRFFHALLENRLSNQVLAYCDNDSRIWNKEIQGIKVLSPLEAVEKYPDAMYVIANLKSANIMKRQLQKLGILETNMCVFQKGPNMSLFRTK